MNKEYLIKLRQAIDENLENAELKLMEGAIPLTAAKVDAKPAVGEFTQELYFDNAGNYTFSLSQYLLVPVVITAWITGLDTKFDLTLETNFPQKKKWTNVSAGQQLKVTINVNPFAVTKGTLKIHSSVPNASAVAHAKLG